MKQIYKFLTSKMFIVALLIMAQLFLMMVGVYILSIFSLNAYFVFNIFSVLMAVYVINRNDNPSYKLSWTVLIIGAPIFGWLFYLLFGARQVPKSLRVRDEGLQKEILLHITEDEDQFQHLTMEDPGAFKQMHYIWKASAFPSYQHTKTSYYETGELMFASMLEQLKQAKSFIFMEYFIIDQGYMWDSVLKVLLQKQKAGVDVRLLYDDFGCMSKLPNNYYIELNKMGIKTKVFNPLKPHLAIQMNNRDHRKIIVIDGKIGMTGGINLADEYINHVDRFGHWKDGGALIEGEAVWSFTLMFLQFWNYDEIVKDDYAKYHLPKSEFQHIENDGIVMPFSDTPTDNENVGEYTHINMINNATKYVYITTPYLVIDQEMKTSLILAAKNGIDVRILVPHIPDKKYVFQLTRYNYQELTKNGVRIFEYTPGFVHSKNFVSDDKYAIVGTANMDFRSYYLHYECGIWFYKSKIVEQLKLDYLDTLQLSQEVTYQDCLKVRLPLRIVRAFLNILAPLM